MNSAILLRITSQITSRCVHTSPVTLFPKRWKEKSEPPFQSELKNPIAEVYGGAEAWPENEVSLLTSLNYLTFISETNMYILTYILTYNHTNFLIIFLALIRKMKVSKV